MSLDWVSWAATDTGTVRSANEDAFVDRPALRLWAVADGAGGHQHGEVASGALKRALDALDEAEGSGLGGPTLSGRGLSGADLVGEVRARVAAVHDEMCRRAEAEAVTTGAPVTIASTIVVFLAVGAHFACLWCGDSRAYLLRDGAMTQLTKDHSLVQEMVDAGLLEADQAERHPRANVLTRAIGADGGTPGLDKITGLAEPGDRFMLCSDGLFKALDPATIARLLASDDPARILIDAALAASARDNVTALVVAPVAAPI